MGTCVNKQKLKSPTDLHKKQVNRKAQQVIPGLQIIRGELTKVRLRHTPLESCPLLFEKFKNSPCPPEEINLTFMIASVEIDIEENTVNVTFINQKEVNIYLILGGEQGISKTGLTVQINNARCVDRINRKEPTPQKGHSQRFIPAKLQQDSIILIMQPVLKDKQSMYILYRFEYNEKSKKYVKKSQSLQWSNLAFNLQEIYGAQNQFRCNAGEVCSICLSSPSNMIFTPCRHMCICKDCSKAKDWKHCPICRSVVRSLIQYG